MQSSSLSSTPQTTYLDAYQASDFVIERTELQFELHQNPVRVQSTLTIRRNPTGSKLNQASLVLDGQALKLVSVFLDQSPLNRDRYQLVERPCGEQSLTINQVPDYCILTITTDIDPFNNTALEGLYHSGGLFCTQCEAEGFRRITFYLDRPDMLSVFTTDIFAKEEACPVLLSNGNLIKKEVRDGLVYARWHDPHPKPCYLFALVAGQLSVFNEQFVTKSGRRVALKLYVESHNSHKTEYALQALKRAMRWDEIQYGREYDLDLFMMVAVDDFNMGAMENKGLNVFNSACILANPATTTDQAYQQIEAIIAHEYFHNWSGNRVTCRDWFQLSLKEGFTVFRDAQFTADMHNATVKRIEDATLIRTLQFAEDAGPMSHAVQPHSYIEISNFYTLTVYEKGSELVRMLHRILGAKRFRLGTDLYFDTYDGQAVTIYDFVEALSKANNIDLSGFMPWYTQAGTPVLTVISSFDAEKKQYRLHVKQTGCSEKDQPVWIPILIGLLDKKGNELSLSHHSSTLSTGLMLLKEQEKTWVFDDIQEEPTPSLLRDFSAPVILVYEYTTDQLAMLMQSDSDGFNCWNASQLLATRVIFSVMQQQKNQCPVTIEQRFIQALQSILTSSQLDSTQKAKMFILPSESYLAQQRTLIDVHAIYQARTTVHKAIAQQLFESLFETYQTLNTADVYQPHGAQVGRRMLKNTLLMYLVHHQQGILLAQKQFASSDNMTDQQAALVALVRSDDQLLARAALSDFYDQWQQDALVVNQWFSVQASSNKLATESYVRTLLQHEAFDINNPNKVRAVLGAFSKQALIHFHKKDGSGYQLLAEYIRRLNETNPQVAARLVAPLCQWKRYTQAQGKKMKQQLVLLLKQKALSKDVYEVVSKSLKV